jgi:hypothetical protein
MSSIDLYMSMGFAREWAERAPANPDAGIPWLLRATTINTMPQRFVREGHFDYTFYKSRVEFIDTEYTVDDYDSRIHILRLTNNIASIWVSLSDSSLRFIEECHQINVEKEPLVATEFIPLPYMDLSTGAMPQDIRTKLCESGTLVQADLGGDWNFHTAAEDGNIWLALLRLTNKNDPSIRFCPPFPRPRSITSQCVARLRTEMKTKISLYSMCVHHQRFNVDNIIHGEADIFEETRLYPFISPCSLKKYFINKSRNKNILVKLIRIYYSKSNNRRMHGLHILKNVKDMWDGGHGKNHLDSPGLFRNGVNA